ncbi:hypothetical protein Tco_1032095 [Tanacetum coccineum]|uniref:Reverse transcriptase domain-containing protein n=1 Tax=Tanacetum coccineum TaxID=301880 RepID=A0ABQ5GBP3_9ASTR
MLWQFLVFMMMRIFVLYLTCPRFWPRPRLLDWGDMMAYSMDFRPMYSDRGLRSRAQCFMDPYAAAIIRSRGTFADLSVVNESTTEPVDTLATVDVESVVDGGASQVPLPGVEPNCFDINLFNRLRMIKCIPLKLRLGFAKIFRSALENVLRCLGDLSSWVQLLILLTEFNDDLVLTSSGVAPSTPDTLHGLEAKHTYAPPLTLSSSPLGVDALFVHKDMVLNRIRSFPKGTSCGRDGLRAQHLADILGGTASAVADDLLGSIIGPGGGLHPIAVGTVWRRFISKVASSSVGSLSLRVTRLGFLCIWWILRMLSILSIGVYYFRKLGSGVQQEDPLGPLLFALALHPLVHAINQSCELTLQDWYLDDGTINGDTLMVVKALDIIITDGPTRCLILNVDKTELFWTMEDPRGFCLDLALKRVSKTISLMEAVHKLHDPQFEFDPALRTSLKKIFTASGPGFGD